MKSLFVMFLSLSAISSSALYAAEAAVQTKPELAAAERYAAECGTCHMAYPAGFLPARSWQKLMGNLGNHFGENAELNEATRAQLTAYLLAGGDQAQDRHAARFAASAPAGETPLRITGLPYFKREHREIPQRYIRDNAQVGSLSNCS